MIEDGSNLSSSSSKNEVESICMPEFERKRGKIVGILPWDAEICEMEKAILSVKREMASKQVQMELLMDQFKDLEKKQKYMIKEKKEEEKRQNEKKSWYEDCRLAWLFTGVVI